MVEVHRALDWQARLVPDESIRDRSGYNTVGPIVDPNDSNKIFKDVLEKLEDHFDKNLFYFDRSFIEDEFLKVSSHWKNNAE